MKKCIIIITIMLLACRSQAENGYDLWLRYKAIDNKQLLTAYRQQVTSLYAYGTSATLTAAKEEFLIGTKGLLETTIPLSNAVSVNGTVVLGTAASLPAHALNIGAELDLAGAEGYVIVSRTYRGKKCIIITANTDKGILYGVFHFLRLLQTQQSLTSLAIVSLPELQLRLLNHWDNLDRTVERGYAGFSLWDWHKLPGYIDKRYKDYARANASIGINGTVLTNVNANATVLTRPYLEKAAALANVFRPYGIRVYLTARFSAPIEIGGLKTADPLDPAVQEWWKEKVNEIYSVIPDFGGFLVKANSEGQPGPQNYGRNHADGANMLAKALAPHKGIVMWRAFVYSNEKPEDRHKQAYNEFVPLDGKFDSNVIVQVKNGAIDFQPREPFHPLFGSMPHTPLMMEFQITQEYLGQATNLVYLAPLFKECLESNTYLDGKGYSVADVLIGRTYPHPNTGMAGVSNIGTDINWCGHPFAQANWYALGRLAWDYTLSSEEIADEWLRMSFTNDVSFIKSAKQLMLRSREIAVQYMTPMGLHHLMGTGHHYGPAPWINNLGRADWNPVYYHRADSAGIGFDRTSKGSDALAQYPPEISKKWEDPSTTPEQYLLWFHHLPWTWKTNSGRTVWEELCHRYNKGVDSARWMIQTWDRIKSKVDSERAEQVSMLLRIQKEEAKWWRDACLLYFQTHSKMPIPAVYEQPAKTLEYYKKLRFPFAPGN
jgi:alpha-glucuronidase